MENLVIATTGKCDRRRRRRRRRTSIAIFFN